MMVGPRYLGMDDHLIDRVIGLDTSMHALRLSKIRTSMDDPVPALIFPVTTWLYVIDVVAQLKLTRWR